MNRPSQLSSASPEVREYVEELEAALNGSSNLIKEINISCDDMAKEIREIRLKGNLLYEDKAFDKMMLLIEKTTKLRALNEVTKKDRPAKVKKEEEKVEEVEEKPKRRNIQDYVLNKVS